MIVIKIIASTLSTPKDSGGQRDKNPRGNSQNKY